MRWTWPAVLLLTACTSAAGPDASTSASASADPTPSTSTAAVVGDDSVVDDSVVDTPDAPDDVVVPEGFATSQAVVTEPDGTTCELCVWVADTPRRRSRGLMFATDLGPADAMVFRYPDPHTGTFWMKNTPLPLSIAFFAPDGSFLDSFDMEPCLDSSCPDYGTPRDFLVAIEVPQGELANFGLVPGSSLAVLDLPCDD